MGNSASSEWVSNWLRKNGLIQDKVDEMRPLTGGVSSDIWLIRAGEKRFVLKQALSKLKVADHWEADVSRNLTEQAFIRFMEGFAPAATPRMLLSAPEVPCFLMEYLGPPFTNWKQQLLDGKWEGSSVQNAITLLTHIHTKSSQNSAIFNSFRTDANFFQLRVEPYLLTTGQRHPPLTAIFQEEANRLMEHHEALVHGDFSPKNILVSPERLVLLDHEVAWYGDPAFDLAFFLTHLCLKQLLHRRQYSQLPDLPRIAWDQYMQIIGIAGKSHLLKRASRLWLMIMLARVDGKSPVEYLNKPEQQFVREFVSTHLPSVYADEFPYLHQLWKQALN